MAAGLMRENCGMIGFIESVPRACSAAMANEAPVVAATRPMIPAKARRAVSRSSCVADDGSSVMEPMLARPWPINSNSAWPAAGVSALSDDGAAEQRRGDGELLAARDLAVVARVLPPLRRRVFGPFAFVLGH